MSRHQRNADGIHAARENAPGWLIQLLFRMIGWGLLGGIAFLDLSGGVIFVLYQLEWIVAESVHNRQYGDSYAGLSIFLVIVLGTFILGASSGATFAVMTRQRSERRRQVRLLERQSKSARA